MFKLKKNRIDEFYSFLQWFLFLTMKICVTILFFTFAGRPFVIALTLVIPFLPFFDLSLKRSPSSAFYIYFMF